MSLKVKERWLTIRQSRAFIIISVAYSIGTAMATFSMFHPMLPFYLRRILRQNCSSSDGGSVNQKLADDITGTAPYYNVTNGIDVIMKPTRGGCQNDTYLEAQVSEKIGVIAGTGSIMMLISCLISGYLIQRFSVRFNLIASWALNLLCPVLAYFADDVIVMCFANGAISAGQTYSFVAYAAIFTAFAEDDKQLTRFHGSYRIFNGMGFVAGYSAASVAYQFLGQQLTMAILAGVVFMDLFFRTAVATSKTIVTTTPPSAPSSLPMLALDTQNPKDNDEPTTEDTDWKYYCSILVNPFVILTNVQIIVVYITTSIFWGTAPNFVATNLGAEQWQTGVMMGIGTTLDLGVVLLGTMLINTQKRRVVALFATQLLFAGGYIWYPFVGSVWSALPPETLVRIGKDIIVLLLATMYPYICDQLKVKNKDFIYAVCTTSVSLGFVIGFYISGVLVVMMTFKWLYIMMGATSILMCLSTIGYIWLRPSQGQTAAASEHIHVSMADLDKPTLGIAELTASRLSLRQSNFSLNHIRSNQSLHGDSKLATRDVVT